jgi:hypothetical protein
MTPVVILAHPHCCTEGEALARLDFEEELTPAPAQAASPSAVQPQTQRRQELVGIDRLCQVI